MAVTSTQIAVRMPGELLRAAAIRLGLDALSRSQLLRYFTARRAGHDHGSALEIAYGVSRPVAASENRFLSDVPAEVFTAAMERMPDGASQGDMLRSALYEFGLLLSPSESLRLARVPMGRPRL